MEAELLRGTWLGLRHFLGDGNPDPEDKLESLDLVVEDVVGDMVAVADKPCPAAADDVLQNHCKVKASGSTLALEAPYLRRMEEDNCTT